jgi:hypothetical protein
MNYMATLSHTYPSEDAARRAVRTLRAAGAPPCDIRLLTSRALHNVRDELVGGFAGPVAPDAPGGNYGGVTRRRAQATGSFATGSARDPHRQREGSFADAERVVVVIYKDDKEHSRVTGYRGVRRLLRRAALHNEAINRAVKELHTGHAVVLVDVTEISPSEARAHLEQLAQAA